MKILETFKRIFNLGVQSHEIMTLSMSITLPNKEELTTLDNKKIDEKFYVII